MKIGRIGPIGPIELSAQPQRLQHQIANSRNRHAFARPASMADQDRPVERSAAARPWLPRTIDASSGTTSSVMRKPSFFVAAAVPREVSGIAGARIEEEFARVETGLVVDRHRARIVRCCASSSQKG